MLGTLLGLALPALAFTPPAVATGPINSALFELASEIKRSSVKDGGTVNQALKVSSSLHVTGATYLDGAVRANSLTVTNGTTVSGNINWPWKLASSGTIASAGSVSLPLPATSSVTFRVYFVGKQEGSAGSAFIRFNSDSTAANYDTGVHYWDTDGTVNTGDTGNNAGKCYAGRSASQVVANGVQMFDYMLFGDTQDQTKIDGFGSCANQPGASGWERCDVICHYDGGSDVASIQVHTSAGTLHGKVYVYKLE